MSIDKYIAVKKTNNKSIPKLPEPFMTETENFEKMATWQVGSIIWKNDTISRYLVKRI